MTDCQHVLEHFRIYMYSERHRNVRPWILGCTRHMNHIIRVLCFLHEQIGSVWCIFECAVYKRTVWMRSMDHIDMTTSEELIGRVDARLHMADNPSCDLDQIRCCMIHCVDVCVKSLVSFCRHVWTFWIV